METISGMMRIPVLALAAASLVAIASVQAGAPAREQVPAARDAGPPDASLLFPDAPHGVDPVVTGPVSKAFRQRQKQAGCEAAVWPRIPAPCYPG